MATIYWHLDELSGSTLTLRLYPQTSGSIANGAGGDGMTEDGDGLFSATVDDSLTGWHKAYADRSGAPVAVGWVNMSDASRVVVETIAGTLSAADITSQPVQPYSSHAPQRVSGSKLTAFLGEGSDVSITVTCYDADGGLLPLDGLTLSLIIAAYDAPDTPLITPQAISGSGSTFDLILDDVVTASEVLAGKAHHWSLRDGTEVIQRGRLEVVATAAQGA